MPNDKPKSWRDWLPIHPKADRLPLLPPDKLRAMADDIKKPGGLRQSAVFWRRPSDGEPEVLDGRNRLDALELLGEKITLDNNLIFDEVPSDIDAVAFIVSVNIHRRHLTAEERQNLLIELIARAPAKSDRQHGKDIGVDHKTIALARAKGEDVGSIPHVETRRDTKGRAQPAHKAALKPARDETLGATSAGELERLAARISELENQKRLVEIKNLALESELEDAAAERATRQHAKKVKRDEREQALAAKVLALPNKKYGVIVEDYEWDHETWSEAGKDRHASNHYPTSTDAHEAEEIVARTKGRFICAAEDCVLFMWSTVQHLAIAIDVLRMRGFDYKSHYVWGKDKVGTGYWSRNKHEVLLIGVRGKIPCPAQGTQWDSLIMAPRGEHSAKPECFLEMIEQYFPNIPKIELNRRGPARAGWDAWGNEADPAPPQPSAPAADCDDSEPLDLRETLRPGVPNYLVRRREVVP